MRLESIRFGELEISDAQVISMPEGLVGMEEIKRFCILEESPESPVKWLQVIDRPALAFVAVNPYDFFSDYEFEVAEEDARELGLEYPGEVAVFVLLSIGTDGDNTVTANLVAPVVVNLSTNTAKQLILQDEAYTTKHVLWEDAVETAGARSA